MSNKTLFYDTHGNFIINDSQKIIETFALLDVANKTNVNNSKNIKQLDEINETIDRSTVINSLTKLMSNVINEVTSENISELAKSISLSNKINISKIKAKNVTLSNISQVGEIDTEVTAEFIQKIETKIRNDISKKIDDKISNIVDSSKKNIQESDSNKSSGSSIGDIVGNIVDTAGDVMKEVLSLSIGNTTNIDNSINIDEESKKNLKIDDSFKFKKNKESSDKIKNALDNKNLSKCAQSTNQTNELNFSDAELEGDLKVTNIKQIGAVKAVMKCAFNNEILNDLSTKILQDYITNVQNMIKSADEVAKKTKSASTSGDIYAVGVAGAKVLEGAGKGISVAAEGVGDGVSTAAEGVGEGVSSALSGLVAPLIIGGIVMVIFIVAYIIFKKMGGMEESGDYED
jgi:hypothetical protein